jgi:hypothetical protein
VGFGAGGHLSAATVPVGLALSEKERVSDVKLVSTPQRPPRVGVPVW